MYLMKGICPHEFDEKICEQYYVILIIDESPIKINGHISQKDYGNFSLFHKGVFKEKGCTSEKVHPAFTLPTMQLLQITLLTDTLLYVYRS